jgi:hypothetical protein
LETGKTKWGLCKTDSDGQSGTTQIRIGQSEIKQILIGQSETTQILIGQSRTTQILFVQRARRISGRLESGSVNTRPYEKR